MIRALQEFCGRRQSPARIQGTPARIRSAPAPEHGSVNRKLRWKTAWLLALASAVPAQEPWPGWGGPGGTFRGPPAAATPAGKERSWPQEKPAVLWERSIGGGYGGLAADAEGVYFLLRRGEDEVACALSPRTGKILWEARGAAPATQELDYGPGPFATAQIAGDLVIFQGGTGVLRAHARATGVLRWRRDLAQEFPGPRPLRGYGASPLLVGESIVLTAGAPGASVIALDPATGELRWKRHSFGCDYATPIAVEVGDQVQIVAHMEQEVIGLDPRNGDLLWSRPSRSDRTRHVIAPLDLGAGRILVSTTHDNECLDLRGAKPRLVWTSRRICAQVGNLLHVPGSKDSPGFVLGASSALAGALLVALDDRTGRVLWRERGVDCGYLWASEEKLFGWSVLGELTVSTADRKGLRLHTSWPLLDEDKAWSAPAMTANAIYLKGRSRLLALRR